MENNKKFLTIIVILSVLLVGSLGYITYDKLSDKQDNTNEVKNDNKENKDNKDNKDDKTKDDTTKGDNKDSQTKDDKDNQVKTEVKVETSYTKKGTVKGPSESEYENYDVEMDINVPKLTGNTKVTESINKKIQNNIYDNEIKSLNSKVRGYSVNYNYIIKNDIVLLDLVASTSIFEGSGYTDRYNYFYDIKNDKELTLLEAMKKIGLSEEEFYKKVRNSKEFSLDSKTTNKEILNILEKHYCSSGLEIIDNKIYTFVVANVCA